MAQRSYALCSVCAFYISQGGHISDRNLNLSRISSLFYSIVLVSLKLYNNKELHTIDKLANL